jgi:hypothetical protein
MASARTSAFSVRYLPYDYHGSLIRLPAIHVRLGLEKEEQLKSFALVDSGATASFLPFELADIMGCRLSLSDTESEGAGGCFRTRRTTVNIALMKGTRTGWSGRMEFLVPTEEKRIPYVILGRDSVFRAYDITFRENAQKTVFRRARRG